VVDDSELTAGSSPAARDGGSELARKAGRGGLAVAFAKIYFMLGGLVQQIALSGVLGLADYGALSSILSISGIVYNPIVSTSIQGVSRGVAQTPDADQPAAIRRTLKIHVVCTTPIAVAFFFLAGPIGRVTGAPHIILGLRIMSGVLFFYGMYAPFIGVLNGTKRFLHQAALDMTATTLRTVAMIAAAWYFATRFDFGFDGATIGFVASSALVFAVAVGIAGIGRKGGGGPSITEHLKFIAPLYVGQLLLQLLLQADLTLLRTFAAQAAVHAGLPETAADPLVGAYRATQLYCFLPYQLLLSVVFILFPMLATAYRDGDREAVARYVRTGVRLALIIAGAIVSATSGLSGPLLRLVFPAEAAVLGTRSMQLLTLGFGAFAIFVIMIAVLNSLKRERTSALITVTAFALVAVLCFWRVRGQPFGPGLLWRTAVSTSAGLGVATIIAAFTVKRTAGAVVSPVTLVRVLLAMAAAIAVGRALPHLLHASRVLTVVFALVVGCVYVAGLLVLREVGQSDLALAKTVLGRRRRG
jgi:stage V sporulation protein B